MSVGTVKVYVVEDSPAVRTRLLAMLATVAGVEVIGAADSVAGAVDGVLAAAPEAVILDLQLLDGTGFEVLARIKPLRPDLRVIILSNFVSDQYRAAGLAAGASVFLDKSHEFVRVPDILRGWVAAAEGARA
ncbi:MAG: response regulator transcription factor [Burkholderiales bacterium]